MIGVARGFICNPELPNKARKGRLDEIRRCLGLFGERLIFRYFLGKFMSVLCVPIGLMLILQTSVVLVFGLAAYLDAIHLCRPVCPSLSGVLSAPGQRG
jgi:hypothetical protein